MKLFCSAFKRCLSNMALIEVEMILILLLCLKSLRFFVAYFKRE
jgi:hypothetical protein